MAMELEPKRDGHWHFILGPVEKWIVVALASILAYGGVWFAASVQSMQKMMQEMAVQQAVTTSQITTLSAQLADVPSLTRTIAEHDVRIDRNTQDIAELRQIRRPSK